MKVINGSHRSIVTMLFAALLVVAFSAVGFADLRIVTDSEGERSELLMKNSRIATPMEDGSKMIFECRPQEVTIVSNGEYWKGSLSELHKMIQEHLGEARAEIPQEIGGFLGGLFGGGAAKSEEVQVRVTRVGDERVGPYSATQYRVETGDGSNWTTHEQIWLSRELQREVQREVGDCYATVMDLENQFAEAFPFGMDDAVAVMKDPEYRRLLMEGYPVKTVSKFTIFGMTVDIETVVVEVSNDPIPEDAFTIPSHYRRVSNPFDALGY